MPGPWTLEAQEPQLSPVTVTAGSHQPLCDLLDTSHTSVKNLSHTHQAWQFTHTARCPLALEQKLHVIAARTIVVSISTLWQRGVLRQAALSQPAELLTAVTALH